MEVNKYISILISSREHDRKNSGNLINFLTSLRNSISNPNNIEVIFKFDKDDDIIEGKLNEAKEKCPDLNVKYVISDRYGYLGLHKAYYDCLKEVDSNSKVIVILADDFDFHRERNWDLDIIKNSFHIQDEPFIVQDSRKIGKMHDIPTFSKKIIDLVTLGNSLSVDGFLIDLCEIYLRNNLNNYIVFVPEFTSRKHCNYDVGIERKIESNKLGTYLASQEYKEFLKNCENKIKNYFNI
jgi:hypothetical protein